jgi:hypothetical protein
VFTRHQGVLVDKVLDPIKDAVILDAIARNEIPPPALLAGETMVQALRRATAGEWRFPAKLSIDVGRESAANMNENRQGAKSLQEIAAEEGTDAFSRLEQIAIEASFVKELSTKYKVPETSIRLVTNSLPSTPAAAAAAGENVGAAAADAQAVTGGGGAAGDAVPSDVSGAEAFPDISAQIAPLNGAQIAAVLAIIENLRKGDLTPESAQSLMISAGMAKESAQSVSASVAKLPKKDAALEADHVTINFADGTYIPTNAIAANAKRALDVRETKPASQRGMTSVGLARARDLMNKRPQSEDTVRRMKAFFDRHEADKQGETWDEKGKGWQAWNGWGGDEGYAWATAIVERLNKQAEKKDLSVAAAEVQHQFARSAPLGAEDWLDAVQKYRAKQMIVIEETKQSVTQNKSIIELTKKKFDLPTPNSEEKHEDFMTRCMADPVATSEFPDAEQRTAVCMRQHEGMFAKVGERGAIVGSDKAPKSDTPRENPKGEGSAKGDASGKRGADVTAEQEVTLQNKADDFNEKDSNTRNGRATLGALKSVFQRGLGAFNTSSSPRVTSASQWAFARVNAYLFLLKNGRPENPKYTTDNDLLPEKHPKAGK